MSYPLPLGRATDSNGNPVPSKLYVYDATTDAPTSVYTDAALTTAAANPLSSDSAGLFVPLYADVGTYRFVVTDEDANVLFEFDDYEVPDTSGIGTLNITLKAKTSNYTVATTDRACILKVDASSGDVTVTASSTTMANGYPLWIVNAGATGSVIVQPSGSETINGAASYTLSTQYAGIGMVSEGSGGWLIFTNTGGTWAGDTNFTGNIDIDSDLNVDGGLTIDQAVTEGTQTLTDGANISWDMSAAPNAVVTLGGNRTLDAPTGEAAGMRGILRVVQDATGSRTLTWANAYKFPNGNDEKPSSAASSTTLYAYWVRGSDDIIVKKLWVSGRDSIGFWREFTAAFAVGNGSGSKLIDTAHGLGRYPAAVQTYLECTTTDLGYAVGDRILCDGGIGDGGGSARMLMTIVSTTNVAVLAGSVVPSITRKDTNASGTITAASWTAVSRIYE